MKDESIRELLRLILRLQKAIETKQCVVQLDSMQGGHEGLLYEDVKLKNNGDPRMLEMPRSWYVSKESCRHGAEHLNRSFVHWHGGLPKSFGAQTSLTG